MWSWKNAPAFNFFRGIVFSNKCESVAKMKMPWHPMERMFEISSYSLKKAIISYKLVIQLGRAENFYPINKEQVRRLIFFCSGQFGDRRTMLGELNWIFTAITDTIAWNTLPRPLFQKLFRQDLLVSGTSCLWSCSVRPRKLQTLKEPACAVRKL